MSDIDDLLNNSYDNHKAAEAMTSLAGQLANYYKALLAEGIPDDLAYNLVLGVQDICLRVVRPHD